MTALARNTDTRSDGQQALQMPVSEGDALAAIFARVLGRQSVGNDEDFFDLGGDSLKAVELMTEIKEALGPDLPITIIYDAPTVTTLLAAITLEYPAKHTSNLILLRAGGVDAPLFIAHGLGGSVMELRGLAAAITTDQAVYGIEARGLDGQAEPLDRIPDMARFHVEALRHIQPRGPYFLAGFSFGGLVAFEMAQMLTAAGEEVASLSLLDSFPHTKFWPLRARIASWRQLVKFSGAKSTLTRLADYHCSAIRGKSAWIKAAYIAGRSVRALRLTFDIFRLGAWLQRFADFAAHDGQGSWSNPNVELPATVLEVQRAGDIAYRTYRPQYYDGEITFIKADREMRIPFDARVLWAGLVRRMTVMAVPSDHQNLVRSGTADLARLLTECIATAQPR